MGYQAVIRIFATINRRYPFALVLLHKDEENNRQSYIGNRSGNEPSWVWRASYSQQQSRNGSNGGD